MKELIITLLVGAILITIICLTWDIHDFAKTYIKKGEVLKEI